MDKKILNDYMDACELIKETENDIKQLEKKKKTIIQTNVSGSNPDFPYNPTHFKIQGTTLTYSEDHQLRMEESILEERKKSAQKLKLEVDAWLNTIPKRMQRIIRYKVFNGLTWEQTASKIGRKATGESIRQEFRRFMELK
ncbi:MAG: RNA polymerase subunit sigma-70 [Fusicatenibacter sp.]|nr:RNA polymerase subunit sigma-70 [Fusicatenibacter sp.]